MVEPKDFYAAALAAGAIAVGFSATFLQFRIQREANYYRQPVASYEKAMEASPGEAAGTDALINLSHFSSSFLLIICGVVVQLVFGFCFPLMALANSKIGFISPRLVAGGLVAGLVIVLGYFCCELVHYRILNVRLLNDKREWGTEWRVVVLTLLGALLAFAGVFYCASKA